MKIKRNKYNNTISISQTTYINDIAEKFGVTNNYPISTPMDSTYKPTKENKKMTKGKHVTCLTIKIL